MFSGILYKRKLLTVLFCVVTVIFALLNGFGDFSVMPHALAPITVTYYFFAGMILFLWRELVPVGWPFFFASAVCAYLLQLPHHTVYLAPIFISYCTIFIGMLKLPRIPLIDTGDYSYGIYLYGFPITQAFVATFPSLQYNRTAVMIGAGSLTFAFAAFSWHVIEKQALSAKRHLPKTWFPIPQRQSVPAQTDPVAAPRITI